MASKAESTATKTVEAEMPKAPSPSIQHALAHPETADVGSGKLSHGTMNHLIKSAGGTVDHVGGTLPPISFNNVGDAYLLLFLARDEETAEREFSLLIWEVLDPKKFVETKDVEASKLYRGSITESWAFKDWCAADSGNIGKVAKVTYLGEQKTKRDLNKVKLYAIEEIQFAVDSSGKPAPKGKAKK